MSARMLTGRGHLAIPISGWREHARSAFVPRRDLARRHARCGDVDSALLALPRNKVRKIEDIGIGDRLEHLGHGGVVSSPHVPLILSHRLDEKILALPSNARDVVMPREIRVVADVAPELAYQRSSTLNARWFAWISTRGWRRQLRKRVGKRPQIIVAQTLDRFVHEVKAAQLLAKKKQLDEQIWRCLSAKRRYLRISRLPVLAVARKAWSEPLLDRTRPRRLGPDTEQRHGQPKTAVPRVHWLRPMPRRSRGLLAPGSKRSFSRDTPAGAANAINCAVKIIGDEQRAILHR